MKKLRLVAQIDHDIKRRFTKFCKSKHTTQGYILEQVIADYLLNQDPAPQGFSKTIKPTPRIGRSTTDG